MKEVEMKELETLEAEAIEVETLDHVTLIDTEMNTVVGAVVGAQVTAEIANDKREKGEAEAVAVATKDPSIIDQETIVTLKMTTVDPENQGKHSFVTKIAITVVSQCTTVRNILIKTYASSTLVTTIRCILSCAMMGKEEAGPHHFIGLPNHITVVGELQEIMKRQEGGTKTNLC